MLRPRPPRSIQMIIAYRCCCTVWESGIVVKWAQEVEQVNGISRMHFSVVFHTSVTTSLIQTCPRTSLSQFVCYIGRFGRTTRQFDALMFGSSECLPARQLTPGSTTWQVNTCIKFERTLCILPGGSLELSLRTRFFSYAGSVTECALFQLLWADLPSWCTL